MARHRETDSTRYAAFYGDEIVVALPHLRQVTGVLDRARVQYDVTHRSDALDLARLQLADVTGAADRVRALAVYPATVGGGSTGGCRATTRRRTCRWTWCSRSEPAGCALAGTVSFGRRRPFGRPAQRPSMDVHSGRKRGVRAGPDREDAPRAGFAARVRAGRAPVGRSGPGLPSGGERSGLRICLIGQSG